MDKLKYLEKLQNTGQKIRRWLSKIAIYPTAHTETALVFYVIWLVFLFASLANIVLIFPPRTLLGWILVSLIGLVLLPADIFLPSSVTPLLFRLCYLLLEALLVTSLAVFDQFSIVSYMYFALVGQAAFILSFSLAVVYVILLAGFYYFFAVLSSGYTLPNIAWLLGAVFTLTAMILIRNARQQRDQIGELLTRLEDANQLVQAQAEALERQIKEDSLTGLSNRRYLDNDLPREIERARRFNKPLSLAILDLDHFKQVNDRFSHQVGDEVLVVVAHIFRQNCRIAIDSLVRYGGEEFVIYFPETSLSESLLACERIRHAIEYYDWSQISPGLKVTVSAGVAALQDIQDYTALIQAADIMLYRAKSSGRNRVCP